MNVEGGTSTRGEGNDHSSMDQGYVSEVESLNGNTTFLEFEEFDRANEAARVSSGGPLQYDGVDFHMLTEEHLVGKEFKTTEEAELFYKEYGKGVGFGVRRIDIKYNQHGKVRCRRWVCSKEGERVKKQSQVTPVDKRRSRALTRENCKAAFKVKYTKERECYVVTEFNPSHSHPLATVADTIFLPSHRYVSEGHLAQATSMRKALLRTCHSYDYMVDQCGGYANIGFTMKDLYNKLDSERRAILVEGDAEAALGYMNAKVAADPEFFCLFSVDEENSLANLFWRDSPSLADYLCFGDIIMFDSTYKTNKYGKPLVFFVGMNNHRSTVIFASALLLNETSDTYKWLLRTFLSSMKDKKPISVLTDGDEAMRNAIEEVLPEATHHLCFWHVGKNANAHLHNSEFLGEFRRCMYEHVTPEKFELQWISMREKYNTYGKKVDYWLSSMHQKKERWANAYLRGHFFGGVQSTQRCESTNRCMKDFLRKSQLQLFQCIPLLDRAVARARHKCAMIEFEDKNSTPVLTTELPNSCS